MCLSGFACMYVCVPYVCRMPTKDRRCHQIPRTGVTNSCELLCECWKMNLGPLEKQQETSLTFHTSLKHVCMDAHTCTHLGTGDRLPSVYMKGRFPEALWVTGAGVLPPKAEAQFVYHHLLGESWAFGTKHTCLCSGCKNFGLHPSLLDSFLLFSHPLSSLRSNELSGGSVTPIGMFTVCVHWHNSIS